MACIKNGNLLFIPQGQGKRRAVNRMRSKRATQKKEPEPKQGDYLIDTDENVLLVSRTKVKSRATLL